MTLPVVILAGGLATRMKPYTENMPKSLIDVAGVPFIARQLSGLKKKGARRVVLCIGHLGGMIRGVVGDGRKWGLEVGYSDEGDTLLGTGGAIRRALPLLGQRFLVMYGDSLLDCDFQAVENAFLASGKKGLMTVFRNADLFDASNVIYSQGRIQMYDKKNRVPEMTHIDYGLGALSREAFEGVVEGEKIDLATIYQRLLAEGQLAGFEVSTRFYEIGSPAGLADTRKLFEAKETSE